MASVELVAEVDALQEEVSWMKTVLLTFIVSGRALHFSVPVNEIDSRCCGPQPDVFAIATGRQPVVKSFGGEKCQHVIEV